MDMVADQPSSIRTVLRGTVRRHPRIAGGCHQVRGRRHPSRRRNARRAGSAKHGSTLLPVRGARRQKCVYSYSDHPRPYSEDILSREVLLRYQGVCKEIVQWTLTHRSLKSKPEGLAVRIVFTERSSLPRGYIAEGLLCFRQIWNKLQAQQWTNQAKVRLLLEHRCTDPPWTSRGRFFPRTWQSTRRCCLRF